MLSKERLNELAMARWLLYHRENGVMLRPNEVKREIHNSAKKLGATSQEIAECVKAVYQKIFDETMEVVNSIIDEGKVKK